MNLKEDKVIPTTSEWEEMNMFSKRDLEWEIEDSYAQHYEEKTSSGMFDH